MQSHRDLAARMAIAARTRAFLRDYRLGSENPFPAALEDALAVYDGLVDAAGVDPSQIVVSGDSGGGGLTVSLLVSLRHRGLPLPAAGVLMSPFADLSVSGESVEAYSATDPICNREVLEGLAANYIGAEDPRDPRLSPVFADLAGIPPLLIQVGSNKVLLSDSVRIADKVRAEGGSVELQIGYEMVHVYQMFANELPEGARAIDEIGTFVRRVLGKPAPAESGTAR